MKRVLIRVFGEVQGVTFRYAAAEKGRELGINIEAENLADGSVEILVEGGEEAIAKFVEWCHVGPPFAKVNEVRVEEQGSS